MGDKAERSKPSLGPQKAPKKAAVNPKKKTRIVGLRHSRK